MNIYKSYLLLFVFEMIFSNSIFSQTENTLKDSLNNEGKRSKDTLSSKDIHPQDSPESSGLIVESKDKKLWMRFYGSARVYGSYDFDGLQGGTGFSISEIPVDQEGDNEETFYMTANVTRLGFEVKRKTILGKTLIKIETDFNGTDNKFRIRQAYGQTKHFIEGQTWKEQIWNSSIVT